MASITLTDEQKKIALAHWDKEDVASLTRRAFNNHSLDARGPEAFAIKELLAGENIVVKPSRPPPMGPLVLNDEQKKKIEELAPSVSNSVELTRMVFENPQLKPLCREWRAVFAHYKTICPVGVVVSEEPTEELEYTPPISLQMLAGQVNDYVPTGDVHRRLYDWGKLKASEKRQLGALMSYVRTFGFKYRAGQYQRQMDRTLFISTFFRFTHDKPDLTAEEVDQYIAAASETVNITQIERQLQRIEVMMEDILNGDAESRGRFMPMVELINTTRGKLDQSKKTLQSAIESLVGTRNKRVHEQGQRSSSVLNLFEAWMKDEQMRDDMLDLGIKEKLEDTREVGRIRDLDDMTAIIAGQTEEEGGA